MTAIAAAAAVPGPIVPLLAALPIVAVLVLMVAARWSATRAGLTGLVLALGLALTVFGLGAGPGGPVGAPLGALAEAAFTSGAILWIIVPALTIHRLQEHTGALDVLRAALVRLSPDPRLTAVLIAWFFALLLEGAAGFGTAAALAAPFLVSIGLRPVTAVAAALVGHTVGVAFGAVGTPVVPQAAATGLSPLTLSAATGVYGGVVGWLLLGAVLLFVVRSGLGGPAGRPVGLVLWGVLAGAAFLGPYVAISRWVGPELPTLGGAVLGGALFVGVLLLARPAGVAGAVPVIQGPEGQVTPGQVTPGRGDADGPVGEVRVSPGRVLQAAAPYVVLVVLVLVTRLVGPLQAGLQDIQVSWSLFDGAFRGSFAPLYHPGTMLVLALLVGAVWQRAPWASVRAAAAATVRSMGPVALALLAMIGLARVMVAAGMIEELAVAAAAALGGGWPLVAPLVGALGTFVTGSATASNALFTDLQATTAQTAGLDVPSVLGAQAIGAAVGNATAPHNIIAAAAVVGLSGRESEVLRRTAPVVLPVLLVAGLLALVLSSG